jgi:hypothetical protein
LFAAIYILRKASLIRFVIICALLGVCALEALCWFELMESRLMGFEFNWLRALILLLETKLLDLLSFS